MVVTTDLGRDVSLRDWLAFHRDRLLSVLFQMQRLGIPNPGFPASTIASITGLRDAEAVELAEDLVNEGLLRDEGGVYRLTVEGSRWVSDSPTR